MFRLFIRVIYSVTQSQRGQGFNFLLGLFILSHSHSVVRDLTVYWDYLLCYTVTVWSGLFTRIIYSVTQSQRGQGFDCLLGLFIMLHSHSVVRDLTVYWDYLFCYTVAAWSGI